MKISEASARLGLSIQTLHYYEREGIIPPISRDEHGDRDYTNEDLKWIRFTQSLRSAKLPISLIQQYTKLMREGPHTLTDRYDLLVDQRQTLRKQLQDLETALSWLDKKILSYQLILPEHHDGQADDNNA